MIKFPFLNGQQLNLDWIMQQLRAILNFLPVDQGAVGDILQRGTDRAVWMPPEAVALEIDTLTDAADVEDQDELPIYDVSAQGNYKATVADILARVPSSPVSSVNGQTGAVVLDADDVGALPDTTTIPSDTADLTNTAGFVDAAGAAAAAPVQSVNSQTGAVVLSKSDVGLGNVDNVQQYSASNPPPYPVTSVNGMTGDVIVSGGGGSLLLGAVNNLTLTPPATATIAWQYLKGRVTADGSGIVIYGHFCMVSSTSGWLQFSVSGLSITPPASAVELHGIGIVSESKNISGDSVNQIVDNSNDGGDIKVNIDTSGNIKISIYHAYTSSDTYIPILFPILIPIA